MAFPSVVAIAQTNGTVAAVNKVCNLPVPAAQSGDLLLLLLRSAGNDAHTTPTGWTPISDPGGGAAILNNIADASDDSTSMWYRQADGNEGASVTVLCDTSLKFAALSWRITGHEDPATQDPEHGTIVTGTSTLPDPGSLDPTGAAKDFLWIWCGGWEGEQTSPPAGTPANYLDNKDGASSGTGGAIATNCKVATASRNLNATTEDPPSWTISVSDDWTAWAVAIHPAPPAAPSNPVISPRREAHGVRGTDFTAPRLRARPKHTFFPFGGEFAPPDPANPVIPPIRQAWRAWARPERRSHAWYAAKHQAPHYFPLVIFQEAFDPYESYFQFDATQYTPAPTVFFEVIMRSGDGGEVKARLFNITDGIEVTGSALTTMSTTAVRLRSGALTLSGAKEYRAEIRRRGGGLTTHPSRAALVVQQ